MALGTQGELLYAADTPAMDDVARQMRDHADFIHQSAEDFRNAATMSKWRGPSELSCVALTDACHQAITGLAQAIGELARAVQLSSDNIATTEAHNAASVGYHATGGGHHAASGGHHAAAPGTEPSPDQEDTYARRLAAQ